MKIYIVTTNQWTYYKPLDLTVEEQWFDNEDPRVDVKTNTVYIADALDKAVDYIKNDQQQFAGWYEVQEATVNSDAFVALGVYDIVGQQVDPADFVKIYGETKKQFADILEQTRPWDD